MPKLATTSPSTDDLYATDLYLWTAAQADLLRTGRLLELDAGHLAEEIESVGGSQKSEIRSRLAVLIAHLLKWEHQPDGRKYGWRSTIIEQRLQIDGVIDTSPSLRSWPETVLSRAYRLGCVAAAAEMRSADRRFPPTCPYTIDEILDPGFYPGRPETDVV